jgi:hypothetical protein
MLFAGRVLIPGRVFIRFFGRMFFTFRVFVGLGLGLLSVFLFLGIPAGGEGSGREEGK